MRIRAKISVFATALVAAVVCAVAANLVWLEQRRVRTEFLSRGDVLMEGVLRIARESLSTQDELMLLSYLKFLMSDYPEIEVVVVSRQGHSSLLGEVRTELLYKTVTVTEQKAAEFSASRPGAGAPASPAQSGLPPETFSIQVGFSKSVLDRKISAAQLGLTLKILRIAALGLLIGVAGSLWLGHLLSRPLAELTQAAERIGEGHLDTAVSVSGRDEIGVLGSQFNRMSERLRELVRFKEDLLSTLSHELNTPLSGLKGFLEYLQEEGRRQTAEDRRESYETMAEAVKQMEISLTNALHLFKSDRQPALRLEDWRVRDLLAEVVRLFVPTAHVNGIDLRGPLGAAEGAVLSDKEMLRRTVINLVSNALKFTPPGGKVSIALDEDPESVLVSVSDTGPGIAPEYREMIFTKFFRAPGPDGGEQRVPGSGLGLAIAKQAADAQGGRVWVESEVGKGSTFFVKIPRRGEGGHGTPPL